jgi:hypothetical protein
VSGQNATIDKLRAAHGKLAGVRVTRGIALFARPSVEDWDMLTTLPEDQRAQCHRSITRKCFLGCVAPDGTFSGKDCLDDIVADEGPAIMGNAFGKAVNELAGTKDRETLFF